MTPRQRINSGLVVRIGIDDLVWIAIPPMTEAFLPELRTIQVGRRDAKKREGCDGQGQFKGHHAQEDLWGSPCARDCREARSESHLSISSSTECVGTP